MVDKIRDPESRGCTTTEGVERLSQLSADVALVIENIRFMLEKAKEQGISVDIDLLEIQKAEQVLSELALKLLRINGVLYKEGVRLPPEE